MTTATVTETATETKTNTEKVDSIEQTVAKSNVRTNIHRQIEEYIRFCHANSQKINLAVLAAKEWLFEYGLMNYLNHSNLLKNVPELHFISAEKDLNTACASFINMPENATVLKGLFSDIFQSPYRTSKTGFSYLTNDPKDKKNKKYQIVWADYCSFANTTLLNDFVDVAQNHMNKGLIYLTFCLSEKRGAHLSSLIDLQQYSNADDIAEVTADAIKFFAKKIKGKTVKKIFEVIIWRWQNIKHSNGNNRLFNRSTKNCITPLAFDDSEWKAETKERMKRQNVVSTRLRHKGGWKLKRIGRKTKQGKTKILKTADQIRLDGAVARWENKWKELAPEKKEAIAEKYGVTLRQFACKVAHKHGKLAK